MADMAMSKMEIAREGARDDKAGNVARQGWKDLGRPGQAVLLSAMLVATIGLMLAVASGASAGSCAGTADMAALKIPAPLSQA